MLMPSRFYRRLKVICEWVDPDTSTTYSARKTIDLGDVSSYEESVGELIDRDGVKRTWLYFIGNKPPITIRMTYEEFDKIFEHYHAESGTLDNRSQKKKLNYTGDMKYYFDKQKNYMVVTSYPKDFTFENTSPDVVYDNILYSSVIPMN